MSSNTLLALAVAALSGWMLTACAQLGMGTDESGVEGQGSALFRAMDDNRDGAVSQDELTAYFRAHDSTDDGELDASEFAAFDRPELVSPAHPRNGAADATQSDFLRNPSPTGPDVAAPPALRERLQE